MDEAKLIEKLRKIEALFSGATTEGEKIAAERARQRILERLEAWAREDPPVEYRFSMGDLWSRKVFVALLRRYGVRPYRYRGQRYTTVMARVSARFVDETLWPEFQELSETLRTYLSEVTDRVVTQVIHQDSSEAEVVEKPKQLPPNIGAAGSQPATPDEPPHEPAGDVGSATSKAGDTRRAEKRSSRSRKKRRKQKRR
jgi:hypothetical protein